MNSSKFQPDESTSAAIVGCIAGLMAEHTARMAASARTYAATGIDAIYITGLKTLEALEAEAELRPGTTLVTGKFGTIHVPT